MDNAIYNLEFVIKNQPPITVRTDGSSESDAIGKAWAWILQFHPNAEYVSYRLIENVKPDDIYVPQGLIDGTKRIAQLKGKEVH